MFCKYAHTNSESFAEIHTIFVERQNFILGDCFLLAHLVHTKI